MNARPDTLAALRTELGLDPARRRALPRLGRRPAHAAISAAQLHLFRAGRRAGRATASSSRCRSALMALALVDGDRHSRSASGPAARRGTRWPTPASWARRSSASPSRTSGSRMLLVLRLRRQAALVPAGGFPGWGAGAWPALQGADPAGGRAGAAAGVDPRPRHALGAARDARRGLSSAPPAPRACRGGQALWRHALRNALIPVLTILGLQFSFLLAGTIIIENVFYLPGPRAAGVPGDHPARPRSWCESVVMLLVAAVIVVNFLVDLAYRARRPAAEEAARERAAAAPRRAGFAGRALATALRRSAAPSPRWSRSSRPSRWSGRPTTSPRLDIADKLQPPSAAHWLGTDHFGRDILSMIMVGAGNSIAVALVAVGIGMGIGVPLGAAGRRRAAARRRGASCGCNDLVFAFPALLIADHDHGDLRARARSTPSSPSASSTSRSSPASPAAAALPLWTREFILAARVAGKGRPRITVEHILPNIAQPAASCRRPIQFSLGILAEAGAVLCRARRAAADCRAGAGCCSRRRR